MMDFLQTLKAHRDGLLRIKSQLYWYDGRGWDGVYDRVCLILDAAAAPPDPLRAAHIAFGGQARGALLLIDGCPHWVWVNPEDVEIL